VILHCSCGKTQEFNNRKTPLGKTYHVENHVIEGYECEPTYGWHVDALCEECFALQQKDQA